MEEIAYSNCSPFQPKVRIPEFSSDRLKFGSICPKDHSELFGIASDPETLKWVSWERHQNLADTQHFVRSIESCQSLEHPKVFLTWALHLKNSFSDSDLIGLISYSQFTEIAGQIDFVISKKHWNKGYASEAIKRLCEWIFSFDPKLRRIQCHCVEEHTASRRVMEKSGLCFEGIRREGIQMKENVYNLAIYSQIRSDDAYL